MSRYSLLAVTALILVGCSPPVVGPPEDGPRQGSASPPVTAAEFDVGPIKSAADYLAEPRYADPDIERGELLSLACLACHTFSIGEPHTLGPNLGGLFGVPAASKAGFNYSLALKESRLIWTPRALEAWLAQPADFVPGTNMVFAGYGAASDRRDVVAYLLQATERRMR